MSVGVSVFISPAVLDGESERVVTCYYGICRVDPSLTGAVRHAFAAITGLLGMHGEAACANSEENKKSKKQKY
jgi:hypothetical protein